MPFQAYQANVVFGTNTTGPFIVLANTIQEAADTALRAFDQNTLIQLANGEFRAAARLATAAIGTVYSNTRTAFVLVRDPSVTPFNSPTVFGANAFNVAINTTGYTDLTRPVTLRDGTGAPGATFTSQTFG